MLLVAGVLACIAGCAGPAMSFFMKDIVEVIFDPPDERHEKVRPVFLKFVGMAVGSWLTITLSCLTFGRVSDRMSVRMRETFFSHLLQKDVGWYDSHSSAEMTTRLTQDSHDFREGCGIKMALFLLSLVQVPLGVAVAFVRDWRFASILIGVVPLIGIVLGISMKMSLKKLTMQAELYTKAGGIAETALGSIQTVAAFGGYGREIARYDGKLREAERDGVKAGQSEAFANSLTAVTFNAVFAFGLEVGSIFMLQSYENECWDPRTGAVDDCFNGSVMLSCLFAVLTGGFAMAPAFQQLGVLNRARVAASRMYAIIDDPPAFDNGCGSKLEALRGEVEFRDVHFAYPTRQETAALSAVSFKVPAGSTAAFVGPSGSGKSTSIAMLMRYYDAASGDVLLDGCDIRSLNLSWVRLQMALVQQEPVLFTGTILSNILHGQTEATREDAVKAARVANADGFVSAMDKGYETPVGERGPRSAAGRSSASPSPAR
jgi:ABC-type multidrug transport system fused ATPase/permease subunit